MSLEDKVEDEVEKKVIFIVAEQLGVNSKEIKKTSSFVDDFNADSLDLTELIMSFEEAFGFEISEEESEKLRMVGDVIAFINDKLPPENNDKPPLANG